MNKRVLSALIVLAMAVSGCGTPTIHFELVKTEKQDDLDRVISSFYSASTRQEMRHAVREALTMAPEASQSCEIAALMAYLEDAPGEYFDYLVEALRDVNNDSAALHLRMLLRVSRGEREDGMLNSFLEELHANHPNPEIRSMAAIELLDLARRKGLSAPQDWTKSAGFYPEFALIGVWDNDQGKALDTPLEPENGSALSDEFDGLIAPAKWMTRYPFTVGRTLNLTDRLYPSEWVAGYLASTVESLKRQELALRISTNSPFRIWLNGDMIFEAREVDTTRADQFVIPVTLNPGDNHLLLKSAQREGSWTMEARLTSVEGAPVSGLTQKIFQKTPPVHISASSLTPRNLLSHRMKAVEKGSARYPFIENFWLKEMGQSRERVESLEEALKQFDSSLVLNYEYAMALWNNMETGRSANQLKKTHELSKGRLPLLEAKRGRFYRQRKRLNQSAEVLNAARQQFPAAETVMLELQRTYLAEKWYTDSARILLQVLNQRPGISSVENTLASLYSLKGLSELGDVILNSLRERFPGDESFMQTDLGRKLKKGQLKESLEVTNLLTEQAPGSGRFQGLAAKVLRRMGKYEDALTSLEEARQRSPYSPDFPKRIGEIEHELGNREKAIDAWKLALTLDPEDDRLAHRLEHMSEDEKGPWLGDVPEMKEVIGNLTTPDKPAPGANFHTHLDHEVTRLYPDGTSANIRTFVATALNEAGRDRLTSNTLSGAGRKRILEALAITSGGEEIEASAIRGNKVRFRGLDVGSTIFLQYREDSAPRGYLAKYLARGWRFHSPTSSIDRSEWILWHPTEAKLNIFRSDERIEETLKKYEDVTRVSWKVTDIAPILYERLMPGLGEVGHVLRVSTVPGWEFFIEWEKALLENAFRSSPALIRLADELAEGCQSKKEIVARLHEYVMQEIRYQQDYENHIAGVKPHSAPTVIERRYGDCKDKTVLMTALANHLDIDVHFALIRTRPRGPVNIDVPSQQFNHVIPYIPEQDGIENGFFMDPTADALDLEAIRHDDVGTHSLVYDPKTGNYEWIQVPFQSNAVNYVDMDLRIQLEKDGAAQGEAHTKAVGQSGSRLRVASRNTDRLNRVIEGLIGLYIPGSEIIDITTKQVADLSVPAEVQSTFYKAGFAREEGRGWRVPVPQGWKPSNLFQKTERQYPMVLGVPYAEVTRTTFLLPRGSRVKTMPRNQSLQSPCLGFKRTIEQGKTWIRIEDRIDTLCERISPEEYAIHREFILRLDEIRREEVVLSGK